MIFIQKDHSPKKIKLKEIFNFLKKFYTLSKSIRNQKKIVLISSLWKSSIFSLLIKAAISPPIPPVKQSS